MCLAQEHNAVMPVRLKPAIPWSGFKHSTTEPLRSQTFNVLVELNRSNLNQIEHVCKISLCRFLPYLHKYNIGTELKVVKLLMTLT